MRQRLLLCLFFFFAMAGQLWSFEVLVLKSGEALPYVKAQQGFIQKFQAAVPRQGVKSIVANNIHSVTIEKGENRSDTAWTIQEDRPDLVVAIGKKALQAALLTDRPVVYLLVPRARAILPAEHQATGVSLENSSGSEFAEILRLLPQVRTVGVVYDPDRSEELIRRTVEARPELIFFLRPIRNAREVVGRLEELRGEIDLLWMVPDLTAVSPQTEESYYRFSLEEQVPLFSFSCKHLARGATLATTYDWEEMGARAAELALQVLSGVPPRSLSPVQLEEVQIKTNVKTARKIDLQFVAPGQ